MAIDPYAPCPGGTGKKVKFCCSDLLGDLDKIHAMLQGNQRQACLDYVTRLDKKHPGRACLVTTKASLERDLGRDDEAEQTLQGLLGQQPDNPFALAEAAVAALNKDELRSGMDLLHRAIQASPRPLAEPVLLALADLVEDLLAEGSWLAARLHLHIYLGSNPRDKNAWKMLGQIGVSQAPLPCKESLHLDPAPADAAWKPSFDEALAQAQRGNLRAAEVKFSALAEQAGDCPALWRNLAILRGGLAEEERAAEAWSKLAGLPIPEEEAIEAEALAQFFAPTPDEDLTDLVLVVRPVLDMERLLAHLSADKRLVALEAPPHPEGEGEPPPKAIYLVLDRPLPSAEETRDWESTPRSAGNLRLYGKQTDREARLELIAWRDESLGSASALLAEVPGDLLGPPGEETVVHRDARLNRALTTRLVSRGGSAVDETFALQVADQRNALLERVGAAPLAVLDGKSAVEAARDPAYRLRLSGLVLRLEATTCPLLAEADFHELRRRLGLPAPTPLAPEAEAVVNLPLIRLLRLAPEKLNDEALLQSYARAMANRVPRILHRLAVEVLSRPGLADKINRSDVYLLLTESQADSRISLLYLDEGREADVAAGKSSAAWDLTEIRLRLARGEEQQVVELLRHLQEEHWTEPGVSQAVGRLLVQLGVIHPDGTPAVPLPEAATAAVGAGAAAEPGKLWTPDSAQGGDKPKLWLPGSQ